MPKVMLDSQQIRALLPHRHPLLLVDRVLEISENEIIAEKYVSASEPVLQGHFPDRPIFPGVYILESLAQAAAIFFYHSREQYRHLGVAMVGIDKCRFRKPVLPGTTLQLHCRMLRERGRVLRFASVARVEGETAAEAEFLAMFIDWDQQ